MKVIKMRDGSAVFIEKDFDIETLLGSNKRFIDVGGMIINRMDVTAVLDKEQYDDMLKMRNGMVYTSQGWLGKREYQQSGYLKVKVPESLKVADSTKMIEDKKK
jgi:hypothetical protein